MTNADACAFIHRRVVTEWEHPTPDNSMPARPSSFVERLSARCPEQVRDPRPEPWERVAAIHLVVRAVATRAAVRQMDHQARSDRVYDPHRPSASSEPIAHLLVDLGGRVPRGDDLDG